MKKISVSIIVIVLLFGGATVITGHQGFGSNSWVTEEIPTEMVVDYFDTALTFDSNNIPHIIYISREDIGVDAPVLVRHSWKNDMGWQNETIDEYEFGFYYGWHLSLAIDSNDVLHVSYENGSSGDGSRKLIYANKNANEPASDWDKEVVDDSGGVYSSLALDSNNIPHISYYDRQNGLLKYAVRTGPCQWDITAVDSISLSWMQELPSPISLSIDNNDRVHLAYTNLDDQLKYAYWDGSSWNISILGTCTEFLAIDTDSNNNAHIIYLNQNIGLFNHAFYDGSQWSFLEIDDADCVLMGMWPSIVIDSNDILHISYHCVGTPGEPIIDFYLKYAWFDGSWHNESVIPYDTSGPYNMPGHGTCIALDKNCMPFISHVDCTYYPPDSNLLFSYVENFPPNPPVIDGPTNGKAGTSYNYTLSSIDPDDDNVYYYIDWGDNTTSGWLGPYNSGEMITLNHTWSEQGTYIIQAKAKDEHGVESDWATLPVTMPLDLISSHSQSLLSLLRFAFANRISLLTVMLQNIQTTTISISEGSSSSDASPVVVDSDSGDVSTITKVTDISDTSDTASKTSDSVTSDTKTITDTSSGTEKPSIVTDSKSSVSQNTENNKLITTK